LTKVSSELKVNPVVISSIVEVLYRQWSEGVLNGKGRNKRMVRRDEGNRMQELWREGGSVCEGAGRQGEGKGWEKQEAIGVKRRRLRMWRSGKTGWWEGMRVAENKKCEGMEVAHVKGREDRVVRRDEGSRMQEVWREGGSICEGAGRQGGGKGWEKHEAIGVKGRR
jgi:hypothetical protein